MEQKIIELSLSPAKLILMYIHGHGIKYKWIADNLDLTPEYISMVCREKVAMPEKIREKINELLDLQY